ncbi:MAG: hypothetical protein QGI73_04405 [Candidatus Thalassarchaeaceae archaeon]|nr:hypothetical protein [Euryarchaeota archaeon]MDP6871455.1 hypothetical protein [Candidatus Thalassarchaeaceae archaeon]|tara:strand:- start:3657 stop:4757 length:1101 start_codon:yes stop_codon:yes gene_type:complete
MRGRIAVAIVLASILIVPVTAPSVVGEWSDDGWLKNLIGPERLENGDEFGCHGFEGISTIEENWVIEGCRDYLAGLSDSSRWGENPVSFGIPGDNVDDATSQSLLDSGFLIVGDMISKAPDDLTVFSRNGGSLEKNSANLGLLESAEKDTLVSIWWRARIDDLKVREDKDAMSWLEDQEVWLTTWGEWHFHQQSSSAIEVKNEDGRIVVSLDSSDSQWEVPGSVNIQFDGSVSEVKFDSGTDFPKISSSDRKLMEGWREAESGAIISIMPGSSVSILLEDETNSVTSTPMVTFNNLHHAVTVVGHHTTNLFQWSSDFQESELTFTWLIERPSVDPINWALPVIALGVLAAVPIAIRKIVEMDNDSN